MLPLQQPQPPRPGDTVEDYQHATLIEKEINELYVQVNKGEKRGKRVAFLRKLAAYVLKIIAGGGSLVVATGYFPRST
jgi:hypothetical protein